MIFYFKLTFFILIFAFLIIDRVHAGVISEAKPISEIILDTSNFLLQIFGFLAIISLVIAGTLYFLSAGDPERAKQAKNGAKYSFIGIAVALGGMVLIRTITKFFQ